jgi:hypothetical protein
VSIFGKGRGITPAGPEVGRAYKELEDRAKLQGIDSVEHEAWELLKRCHQLLVFGDESVAQPLFYVARLSFAIEATHRQWLAATSAAMAFSSAVRSIDLQCERGRVPFPAELRPGIQKMIDLSAYAAHRSGVPLAACILAESLTNQMFRDRTIARELSAINRRQDTIGELRRIHRTLQRMTRGVAKTGAATPAGEFRQSVDNMFLDDLKAGAALSSEAYVLTAAGPVHAVHGASATARSVIYLVPGPYAGAAIRLEAPETGRSLCESVELPGLSLKAVQTQAGTVRDVLRGELLVKRKTEAVQEALDKVTETVWDPILAAWPSLKGRKVALVPLGECASLPLYTALIDGAPACATMDLTVVPSGDALMLAGLWPVPGDGTAFVAADPWFGDDEIALTVRETQQIAAVREVRPRILRWPSGTGPDVSERLRGVHEFLELSEAIPDGDMVRELAEAEVVHLACHGDLDPNDPLRSALLLGWPLRLSALLTQDLKPGAIVVLSACHLASIGTEFAAEQLGFPAALLAMGARSVVSALWPVPDSDATVELMTELHRDLGHHPPSVALGRAIGRACADGVRPYVWAPFVHFGA